jgi:acyl-coenzyme A synthetase/AMP-(fatty) acid ligase/3-hydroxymyristoyl/3-hydroxydecanoyl-(acyl carrier protein) dehydratase
MNDALLPASLLSAPPDATAFYRNTAPITYAAFRADIESARRALAKIGTPEIVLFDPDAYAFLVWLLACWQNGQTALLAADDLPATHTFLPLPWVGHCEGSVLPDWPGSVAEAEDQADAADPPCPEPLFVQPGLVVFTSGSSGTPERIFKTPAQIYLEASILQQRLDNPLPPNTRFVGSVPHQHMFGLGHRIMWPLWAGYPIVTELFHHPEELGRLPAEPHVLISSPSLLKRLAQLDAFSSPAHILLTLSAGSPLHDDIAIACAARLGTQMIDTYGSTEAGSVMQRIAPGGVWREHPGITMAIDEHDCLKLRSPTLLNDDWLYTQDTAVHDGNGWRLTGRADRVAKIEGRRVMMESIESALHALPEVAEARTAPLYRERDEIIAAVVLSEAGRARLRSLGKMRFDRWMRQQLSASVDSIALPRRWRYVSALPYNAMGKLTAASIVQLFERQSLPPFAVDTQASGDNEMVFTLALRDCAHAFDGHFPEVPILPGVTQLDWALRLAQRYFPIEGSFSGLGSVKFQRILRPDDEVSLTLRFFPKKKEVRFTYATAHGTCSQGHAVFARPPVAAADGS